MGWKGKLAKGAYGPLVGEIQAALEVGRDLDYGPATERAVRDWQAVNNRPGTGEVGLLDWIALTHLPEPSLFDLCLGVTSRFESHGWAGPTGNFDGAGITAGIIGFNLGSSKSLLSVLRPIGMGYSPLAAIGDPTGDVKGWPRELAPGTKRWLVEVLDSPEGRKAQLAVAREQYWEPSQRAAGLCGFTAPWAKALCFDVHVQNPPISMFQREALASIADERARAIELIDMKAVGTWRLDVIARKMVFVQGKGVVHGRAVELGNFGF